MRKLLLLCSVSIVLFIASCQTVDKKTEEIIKKENEKLSKFIGQPESELKIVMGNPDDEIENDKGVRFLIYKSKNPASVPANSPDKINGLRNIM